MLWRVVYYTRPNGRTPAKEWIEEQDNSLRPGIDARIERLEKDGLLLVENGMLVPVRRKRKKEKFIPGLYELKHKGKKWRIATYHNQRKGVFVLLCGWRKKKARQEWDIDKARELLYEYFSREGTQDV